MTRKSFFSRLALALLGMFFFVLADGFSQSAVVVLVSQDAKNFEKLNKEEKSYATSVFQQFLADLSKDPQITIRTEDLSASIREIQKKSQQEVEKGLATDAYEIDRRTLAKYSIEFSFVKESKNYNLLSQISRIETQDSFSIQSEKGSLSEISRDETVHSFAYDVLTGMSGRGYISPLSPTVVSQLKPSKNNADDYRAYIEDYAKQLSEANKELERLKNAKKDSANKLALEDQERALQLKMEILEQNKKVAEENLRKKQEADEAERKQQAELKKMKEEQQKAFTGKIKEIEERRLQILEAERSNLSLKKRIELIEQGKKNYRILKETLDKSIEESFEPYDKAEAEEVAAKEQEDYKMGHKDSQGNPTEAGIKYRQNEIKAIREKYQKERTALSRQMRREAAPALEQYSEQVNTNLAELQNSSYIFRSIDSSEDYLKLTVDEYDGKNYEWTVHSAFSLDDVPKVYLKYSELPDYNVSYKMMTGKNVPKDDDFDGQTEYLDLVENADLYFRTSVPYLYSEIELKVKYDSVSDLYEVIPTSFKIFKTEDNKKPLLSRNERDFESDRKKEENRILKEKLYEEKLIEAEQKQLAAEQKQIERNEFWEGVRESQSSHNGLILELGVFRDDYFSGVDSSIQLLIGGRHWFFGGGLDISWLWLKDDCYLDVTSPYASRTKFESLTGFAAIGYTVTFGKIAPYAGIGIGGYNYFVATGNGSDSNSTSYSYSSTSSNDDHEPSTASLRGGFYFQAFAGLDYRVNSVVAVGFSYKIKYFSSIGFADSFNIGISLGSH